MCNKHRIPNVPIALLLCGIFMALSFSASATDTLQADTKAVLELNDHTTNDFIQPEVEFFSDDTGQSNFQAVLSTSAAAWHSVSTLAYQTLKADSRCWIRIRLQNNGDKTRQGLWALSSQEIMKAKHYSITSAGIDSSPVSGQNIPLHQRPVAIPDLVFPVELRAHSQTISYIMMEAGPVQIQTNLNLFIQDHPRFLKSFRMWSTKKGLLTGFMEAFCVVALGLVIFFRTRTHVLYFTYLMGATLFVAADRGVAALHFWPGWPQFYGIAPDFFLFVCLSSFVFLVYYLLQARRFYPALRWLLRMHVLVGLVFVLTEIFKSDVPAGVYDLFAGLFAGLSAFSMLLMLGLAMFQFLKHKNEEAGYVALIFVPLLVTSVTLFATDAGLIKKTVFINDSLINISIVTELCIVSIVVFRNQYLATLRFQMQAQENKLLRMQEMERIAADLHDEVGSTLSSISILSALGKGELQTERIKSRLDRINNQTLEVLEIMNDIIWSIKPNHEHTSYTIERMKAFLSNVLQDHNIRIQWQVNDALNTLNLRAEQRKNMYLILKESINNILKYAQASEIAVAIDWTDGQVVMKIRDNGCGFNVHENRAKGNGLGNMQMRAQKINGALHIESQVPGGTTVQVSFPFVP
ncbi:7TM diverse intracellular signaling domain-containing protein [Haliscomenobacter hydrossis]|uniref:histidine kinase n=1 Tax=Haliscomenobacter hydrossis (strain ATCC 27775 / DSM 1100 / LMG 10767 / O) TaxID=760192 RepID=F4KUI0_HALH1|nr:7TM diverse intracellular signaling domain-containing protein [Haliscomenobacter hydrossis]AEE52416.1 putative signal transduction histidine kinase [Haliscomenobacter hydrossis DSM 1100]